MLLQFFIILLHLSNLLSQIFFFTQNISKFLANLFHIFCQGIFLIRTFQPRLVKFPFQGCQFIPQLISLKTDVFQLYFECKKFLLFSVQSVLKDLVFGIYLVNLVFTDFLHRFLLSLLQIRNHLLSEYFIFLFFPNLPRLNTCLDRCKLLIEFFPRTV